MKSALKKLSIIPAIKFFLLPATALAASHDRISIDTTAEVERLLNRVMDWMFTVFMIIAVIVIIYTAFMYLTAAGDSTKVSKARTALVVSIVAIVVALLAGSIPALLQNILENASS